MWYKELSLGRRVKRHIRQLLTVIVVLFLGLGAVKATDLFRSISANIRTYNNVVKNLLAEYVDDIDSQELITASIEGMLRDLDPYTVFIREKDQMSVNMLTHGKYGGVGIRLGVRDDILTVIAPMEGTPAFRAGVRPGDKIIAIDSVDTREYTTEKAAEMIRGKPGTQVILTFQRLGEDEPLDITLIREEIKVNDMPYYGVDDGVGYIKINRFSRDTAKQFRRAVAELQEQGIDGLILDLRHNPGGLLRDAVAMVDAMVEPGVDIVETRGRSPKATGKHRSNREPVLDLEIPVVILVDAGSASASEIVAGAIQDLDRGVILGERTFGKGLVQSIFPLGKNTSIKMTTAKYYIPSGRLIQKEDYHHNGALTDGLDKRDSLFVTRNGRIVKGGGGILPDIEVISEFLPPLTRRARAHFFSFATQNQNEYDLTLPVIITDAIMEDLRTYLATKDIEVTFPGEKDLKTFEAGLDTLESFEGQVDLTDLKAYYEQKRLTAFDDESESIRRELRLEFATLIGGWGERIHASLVDDQAYQRATEILHNPSVYHEILQPVDATALVK
ncbi:MAG: S41 family peptidase [Candidatus Marinimicrobia bacterium]|nr:S41 family peptidase [Candidatus Neomarinimicrobiota bacterium]